MLIKRRLLILFIVFFFTCSMLASQVSAFSIWTEPAEIKIDDVLVGSKKLHNLDVRTDSEDPVTLHLSIGGPIAEWTTIEPKTVIIDKDKHEDLMLTVQPVDTEVGTHTGYLIVTSITESPVTSSMVSTDALEMKVKITDNEVIAANMDQVRIFDITQKDNFYLEGIATNKGNKPIDIQVDVTIEGLKNADADIRHKEEKLMPGEQRVISISKKIDLSEGYHVAKVYLRSEDITFRQESVRFKVLASAEGGGNGFISDVEAIPTIAENRQAVQISGVFNNRGPEQVKAQLIATVFSEDIGIDRVTSEEKTVEAGSSEPFMAMFYPKESGSVSIDTYIAYGEARTVAETISMDVESRQVELSAGPFLVLAFIMLTVALRFILKKHLETRGRRGHCKKGGEVLETGTKAKQHGKT